ncbi:conserved hypothetical protein [Ricinus communis]|uniref:Uncharacterized protein n=1 Tax=Ricinus communis TaxID=3988 RepID=B9TDH7_RICCO|nr:conserved hypothetical protein [Ricinus communis]
MPAQPCAIVDHRFYTSGWQGKASARPYTAAGRGSRPVWLTEASSALAQWPVFGEQIAGGVASMRPLSVTRRRPLDLRQSPETGT